MVRRTDRPTMTIAVDLGHKATKQTNKQTKVVSCWNDFFLLLYIMIYIVRQSLVAFHRIVI